MSPTWNRVPSRFRRMPCPCSFQPLRVTALARQYLQKFARGILTKLLMLPNICLHSHTVEGMLPQKRKPHLHSLRMAILDLDQPPPRDSLKVLLALLVHEIGPRHCPALDDLREGCRSRGWQAEIVCGAHGEVSHELDVADRVRAELKVAGWHAIFRPSAKRCQIGGCNVARWTAELVCFGCFG
jgi:hypothetical protein